MNFRLWFLLLGFCALSSTSGAQAGAPTIASISNSQTITEGHNVTLSVSANGTGPFTYQWRKGGAAISGATSSTHAFAPIRVADAGTYTVVVTNTVGSVTSGPVVLAVNAAIAPTFYYPPGAITLTIGDTLHAYASVSGTEPLTFVWKRAGVTVATTTSGSYSKANMQAADAGSYTVTVSNVAGSITSNAFNVVVNPMTAPVISYGPYSTTVATGGLLSLYAGANGSGTITYQWNRNGVAIPGATSSSYYVDGATAANAGSYTMTATNSAGSTTSAAATVTVSPPVAPAIGSVTESAVVVIGESFSLSVYANGSPTLAYQWRKDGQAIAGATNSYFAKSNAQAADAGTYSVLVSNGQGSALSNSVPVTVTNAQPPVITYHPPSRAVQLGTSVNLSVGATGSGALSYQWKKDGVAIPGANGNWFTLTHNATATVAGSYTVTVSSSQGSVISDACVITVLTATPPTLRGQPATQTLSQGQTLELYANVTGTPSPTIQWRKDGANISGATGSSYYKGNVTAADAGSYSYVATNSAGTATSAAATITVLAAGAPVITQHPASASLLPGDYFYGLEVSYSNATGATVQWYRDGQAIPNARSNYFPISGAQPTLAGTYTAVVTNSAGSATSREAVITVDANTTRPVITFVPGGKSVSGGSSVYLGINTSSTTGETVQWFRDGAAIAGATSRQYSFSDFSPSHAGTYTAQVTTTAGTFTSRPIVLELFKAGELPVITRQPTSMVIPLGDSAGFFVNVEGETPISYQWRKDGVAISGANYSSYHVSGASTNAGSYTVQVTNRNGATTSIAATLAILTSGATAPIIQFQPASQTVTAGNYVSLDVSVVDPTGVTYQWRKDNVNLPTATGNSYYISSANAAAAGRYSVVVTNSLGSVTSSDAVINVINRVTGPTFATQPQGRGVFTGASVTLTSAANGTGTVSYQWRRNGADIAGATSASYTIGSVQASHAGTYSVLATDANGSTPSAQAELVVQTSGIAPTILTSPSPQVAVAGTAVSFTGSAGGTPLPAYQWFRDGNALAGATSATLMIASVQASDAGTYSFRATNAFGAVTSQTATLGVTVPVPVIERQPVGGAVITGQNIVLNVAASGNNLTFQWRKDGVNLPGATGATLALNNFQAGNNGRYSVVVGNAFGSVTSADAVLAGVAVVRPQNQAVTAGANVTFDASVQSTAPLLFRWARNGSYLPGATSATLTLTNVQPADAGTYVLVVTLTDGTVLYPLSGLNALSATLTIQPGLGAIIARHPVGGSVALGGTFTFSVATDGTSFPSGFSFSYQWQKNGVPLPNENRDTLVLRNVQPGDAGDYRVVLITNRGPVESQIARLVIEAIPFAGTYFGTFATGESWALHVNADGTAVFIGLLSARGQAIIARDFTLSPAGQFTFGRPRAAEGEGTPLGARFYDGEVSGIITQNGVSGQIAGANLSLSGQRIEAPAGSTIRAGYFQAVPLAADLGEVAAIAAPDGSLLLVAVDTAGVRGGRGRVESSGVFTVTQPQYEYRGAVSSGVGSLQGVYAPTSGTHVPFATPAATTSTERLINVATRGLAGTGAQTLTAGFVISGNGTKDVLIRGVGPGLSTFGVPGVLANPRLRLFKGTAPVMENDDWGLGGFAPQITAAAVRVGAFGLTAGSADAAVYARLEPGAYTAQITAEGDAAGVALVEVYDAVAPAVGAPRLINLSTRGEVGRDGNILIVGIVVSGTAPKKFLIRGVGPTLGTFGLDGILLDPFLQLYQGTTLIRENDNWSDGADANALTAAATAVGGFTLLPGSKDAALLVYLAPGNYTAQVRGVANTTGVALVEAYEVP